MNTFIARSRLARQAAIAVAFLACCSPLAIAEDAPQRKPQPLDSRYITGEAVAVIVAHPARIMASDTLKALPSEILQAAALESPGINLEQLEQIVMFFEVPSDIAFGGPQVGVVLKFNRPQEPEKLLAELASQMRWAPGKLGDKTFYRNPEVDFFPGLLVVDPTTFLFGMEDVVERMLSERKNYGHLREALAKATDGPEAAAYVSIASLRPLFGLVLQQVPIEPEYEKYRELLRSVSTLQVELQTQGKLSAVLSAVSENEEQAAKTEELLGDALELGMTTLMEAAKFEMERSSPEIPERQLQASLIYFHRIAERVKTWYRPQRDGATVKVALFNRGPIDIVDVAMPTALLLPAINAARQAALRNNAMGNARQITIAFLNYESATRRFPGQGIRDKEGKLLLSWRVAILPYIEEEALYQEFKLDEPWDSEHNIKLLDRMPPIFRSPRSSVKDGNKSNYVIPVGKGLYGDPDRPQLHIRHITDGISKTICLLEVNDEHAVPWTKPEDWEFDEENPFKGLAGFVADVFVVCFLDSRTEALSLHEVTPADFKAGLTTNGDDTHHLGW